MQRENFFSKVKNFFVNPTDEYEDGAGYSYQNEEENYNDDGWAQPGVVDIDQYRGARATGTYGATSHRQDISIQNSKSTYAGDDADEPIVQIITCEPKTIQEANEICDLVARGRVVVIKLEGAEFKECQRIMDFVSGSKYSLGGSISQYDKRIFIYAPKGVHLTDGHSEQLKSQGLFGFARKSRI